MFLLALQVPDARMSLAILLVLIGAIVIDVSRRARKRATVSESSSLRSMSGCMTPVMLLVGVVAIVMGLGIAFGWF